MGHQLVSKSSARILAMATIFLPPRKVDEIGITSYLFLLQQTMTYQRPMEDSHSDSLQ
jgi:hypothetical protein